MNIDLLNKMENAVVTQHVIRQILIQVTTSAVVSQVAYSFIKRDDIVTRIAIASTGLFLGYVINEKVNESIMRNYGFGFRK